MNWTQKPIVRLAFLIVAIGVVGGGWWYINKRSECEQKYTYCPAQPSLGGEMGDYYSTSCNPIGVQDRYQTRKEAISVCLWR